MLKIFLFLYVLCICQASHPFYMSVCDLKYNAGENALQGAVKIFTNDLEDALARLKNKRVDLINANDDAATRALLHDYLASHLEIRVNANGQKINILGFEREEEALWIYVELEKCPFPKKITVLNKVLCDHLPQQMNIVHIQVDNTKSSLKASCQEPVLEFEF